MHLQPVKLNKSDAIFEVIIASFSCITLNSSSMLKHDSSLGVDPREVFFYVFFVAQAIAKGIQQTAFTVLKLSDDVIIWTKMKLQMGSGWLTFAKKKSYAIFCPNA